MRLGLVMLATLAAAVPAAAREQVLGSAGSASLAVSGDGRAFLVSPVASDRSATLPWVGVRSAAPGAAFGGERVVMRSGPVWRAVDAGVAADGSGIVVVQQAGAERRVGAARFGATEPILLSPPGASSDFAASAVAPSGAAVVVWFRHGRGHRWRLEAAVRAPDARRFGQAEPVSGFVRRPCCTAVVAAVGDRGDAVVTWSSSSRPSVWAALRSRGGGFRRARRLAASATNAPRAAVGADGTTAVVYGVEHVPRRGGDGLQLHRTPRNGSFGPAEHVDPGGAATAADVAMAEDGRVLVAWVDQDRLGVSEAARGQPLTATQLRVGVAPKRLAVAAADARAVVAWTQRASVRGAYAERVLAATRAPGQPFGAPVPLGRAWRAAEPVTARLTPGGALVVWKGERYAVRRTALAATRVP
jgi:hypothetical protein